MRDWRSRAHVSAFAILLAILAWLPGAAAEWFGEPGPGDGPRLVYTTRPSAATPEDDYLVESEGLALRPAEQVPQQIDLRGNEIRRPVARYGIDHRGALYELHSPETELPQLLPPQL